MRGSEQQVTFSSSPAGAEFLDLETGARWTAPAALPLARLYSHSILASKPGHRSEEVYLHSQASPGWYAVGCLTLGVSLVFDAILGGLYDLTPSEVHVVLEREP